MIQRLHLLQRKKQHISVKNRITGFLFPENPVPGVRVSSAGVRALGKCVLRGNHLRSGRGHGDGNQLCRGDCAPAAEADEGTSGIRTNL